MAKKKANAVLLSNEYYDNTMLSGYKNCPRYYYIRHIKGWRGTGTSAALIFGLSWHSAMNVVWSGYHQLDHDDLIVAAMRAFNATWTENGMRDMQEWSLEEEEKWSPRTPGTAMEMLPRYIEARKHILDQCKLNAAERPFAVPVFPDKTNVWYIGRMDKDIILNGDRVLIEHKSTSEYKKDGGFKTQYVEGWSPNSQCEGYLYQSYMDKKPARYVWVDAALVHKTVHDKFKFIPIAASTASLDAFLWEMRDWIERIRSEVERLAVSSPKDTHMTSFPKNTESCSGKYGLCSFISICRSVARPDLMKEPPEGFIEEKWEPFDVLQMEKIGMKK